MAGRLQRSVPALLAFVLVVWSGAAFAGGNAAAYSPAALNPTYMQTMGGPGHAQMYPSGDAVAPNGDLVVADTGNDQVARYTSSGALVWRGGSPGTAVGQYFQPRDVAVDAEGEVFVADDGNHRVVKLAADGTPLQTWGQSGDPYLS